MCVRVCLNADELFLNWSCLVLVYVRTHTPLERTTIPIQDFQAMRDVHSYVLVCVCVCVCVYIYIYIYI